jgi:hypothetical protein
MASLTRSRSTITQSTDNAGITYTTGQANKDRPNKQNSEPHFHRKSREILPGWRRCGGAPCGSWRRRARRRASAPA